MNVYVGIFSVSAVGILHTAVGVLLPLECAYEYVYACICMYMQVYYQYLHVLFVLEQWGTEKTTAPSKHTLVTQHLREPTQGSPEHVPEHFLDPIPVF